MLSYPVAPAKQSKYHILGLIGQGQFGRVFCAVHRKTGRLVALKNLEQQRFPTHRFLRELRFLLSLQHPNIVTCYALEHTRTGRYLVMDYCEAGTLRSLMKENMRLNLSQTIRLVADVLMGLEHAHGRGIIHCDIKPDNILLNVQPHGWIARISDFGIAQLCQELSEKNGGNTGSPAYMAPERFYGQHSITSDLYAVGILLFELLTGDRPFSGTPGELMSAHLNQTVRFPDTVPEALRPIIYQSLQKLSARRFRSAADMLTMLRKAAVEELNIPVDAPIPISLPLLQIDEAVPVCPFKPHLRLPLDSLCTQIEVLNHYQETLANPAEADGSTLWWAEGQRLAIAVQPSCDPQEHDSDPEPESIVETFPPGERFLLPFPTPIRNLFVRPQGCFVQTTSGLYRVSPSARSPQSIPELICDLPGNSTLAIEAQGRWVAAITPSPTVDHSPKHPVLTFQALPNQRSVGKLASSPIPLRQLDLSARNPHLLAVNRHHAVLISAAETRPHAALPQDSASPEKCSKTRFEVFTRRGNRVGVLGLPIVLKTAIATFTPFRILATDAQDPHSILLIDLKPFRVVRSPVNIEPQFLAATHWGYILMDAEGQIVVLDSEGHPINSIDGPAHPTAIALHHSYEMLIATWDGHHGSLYRLNLRTIGISFLF